MSKTQPYLSKHMPSIQREVGLIHIFIDLAIAVELGGQHHDFLYRFGRKFTCE